MSKPDIRRIVILGAGRLAVNLSMAIHNKGYEIVEVCNRTESRGLKLARKLNARYVHDPDQISTDADLYILAVSDSAIPLMTERMNLKNHFIVHTSGTVNMDFLKGISENIGVLYPPQTFTNSRIISFRKVPLCIEANSDENLKRLQSFAESLSEMVYPIDSVQRKILHLSAVFANNFTNLFYTISEELLHENGMDFNILTPIIHQTAHNAASGDVFKFQTGPAIREDSATIMEHLKLLSKHPDYQEIYSLITKNIIQRKKKS